MSGSVVVALRTALKDALAAAYAADADFNGTTAAEHNVLVAYAWPKGDRSREKVFTGRPRATTPPAGLRPGRNHRDEEGELEVVVLVEGVGDSCEETDERALAIGAVVEDVVDLRKSNELGVTGLQWLRIDRWELNNAWADRGHLTEVTYTLRYSARIAD